MADATFKLMPGNADGPEDVERTIHQVKAPDGVQIDIYEFRKTTISRESPGPAILHCHGGGMILGSVSNFERSI
jgi:acetyl esterase/lipase